MPIKLFQKFIQLEASSGIVLMLATLLALLLANSPLQDLFNHLLHYQLSLQLNHFSFNTSSHIMINDGLMSIFFLIVSLEIKRELIQGELNSINKALLPIIAAAGGMLFPALIYFLFNINNKTALPGWAIPTATDIAFSLGILSLLGRRIPMNLKIFLTALAIIDDLGAIIIIAVFYTANISKLFLILALVFSTLLILLNYFNTQRTWPYLITGSLLWFCILKSGIHATIAGVILGLAIPLKSKNNKSLSQQLEKQLHPWVAYGILPLFALANANLAFNNLSLSSLANPITLGIITGLFFGKQLGILLFSWLAIKYKLASLPHNIDWRKFYGMSLLCGIGFTMSLFIGTLAFNDETIISLVRLGIIIGSVLSGLLGYFVLRLHKT